MFLPGFQAVEDGPEPGLVTGLDHLTYVVRPGKTAAILAWYKHCCGMQRFNLSPQVSPPVVKPLVGQGGKLSTYVAQSLMNIIPKW